MRGGGLLKKRESLKLRREQNLYPRRDPQKSTPRNMGGRAVCKANRPNALPEGETRRNKGKYPMEER